MMAGTTPSADHLQATPFSDPVSDYETTPIRATAVIHGVEPAWWVARLERLERETDEALRLLSQSGAVSPQRFLAAVEQLDLDLVGREVRLLVCAEARRALRIIRRGER